MDNAARLSNLPAPRKKRKPVLLTALAKPIPDSESDVRLAVHTPIISFPCLVSDPWGIHGKVPSYMPETYPIHYRRKKKRGKRRGKLTLKARV